MKKYSAFFVGPLAAMFVIAAVFEGRVVKILMRPSEGNIAAAHLPTDQFFSAKRLGKT